ncbi:MAG: M23 family metallopeptidase [Nannocystales bacterium]
MRRWLPALVCALSFGCDDAPEEQVPARPPAPPPAAAQPDVGAGVEVIEQEEEPLAAMVRLGETKTPPAALSAFTPGAVRDLVLEVKLTEGRKKTLHVPRVRLATSVEVLDGANLHWKPHTLTTPQTDGADEAFLSAFRAALQPTDPPGTHPLKTDEFHAIEALPWPGTADAHVATVASALRLTLGHLRVSTPDEGLSKGANWTVQRQLDLFGVPTWERLENTASKIDGHQLEVSSTVSFLPTEDGAAAGVQAFGIPVARIHGEGKLRARFDLDAGLPVDMQLQGKLTLTGPDGTTKTIGFELRADEDYLAAQDPRVALTGEVTDGGLVVGKAPAGTKVWFNKKKLRVSEEGDFVFGFRRDAPPRALLAFGFEDTPPIRHILHVKDRTFEPEAIDGLPEEFVNPDKETKRALAKSRKRIEKVRTKVSKTPHYAGGFAWPARGKITSTYGRKRILNGEEKSFHWGIDIAGRKGSPVKSPAAGVVVFAEEDVPLAGNLIILDHGHGLTSSFLHLQKIKVQVGDEIKQGQNIATLGNTGRSTGPHLDWRMNWLDTRVDPQLLVPAR